MEVLAEKIDRKSERRERGNENKKKRLRKDNEDVYRRGERKKKMKEKTNEGK